MIQEARTREVAWNPSERRGGAGRPKSKTLQLLEGMGVGDVVELRHPDVVCGKNCTTRSMLCRLGKAGREYEHYHTGPHVMVVKRLK